ncbi:MAG: extracellular solute-binding protein [Anaerolineaceae bacterium]|nr:extracellular solute-binding protein [Anaerolineaceae bacterium]
MTRRSDANAQAGPARAGLGLALALLSAAVALLLGGCDLDLTSLPVSSGTPTRAPATGEPTAEPAGEPTRPPADSSPPPPTVISLTIWTTEAFSPTEAITTGQILAQVVAAFEADHPDLQVEFVLKKPYGKGGMLDYLLTTGAAVPDLLPDLAFVDVDELPAAVQGDVVQPLDDLLPPELAVDLYAFARRGATFDDRLMGLQFQADLDHLVYNTGVLAVPPRSWPGVLSNAGPYIFPAGGQGGLVNDDFLIQYLAVRPWPPLGGPQQGFLDLASLAAVLQFYQDGVTRGVFPAKILEYHDNEACWVDYLAGRAALTHVSARRYMADREQLQSSAVAPIPGINGATSAIGRGWALVLVASDPARQALAVELMARLLEPEVNASWNQAAGTLPTRQSVLATSETEDSYERFIHQQLTAAQPRPRLPNYAQVAAALQNAVQEVVAGTQSPEEAAAELLENQ